MAVNHFAVMSSKIQKLEEALKEKENALKAKSEALEMA